MTSSAVLIAPGSSVARTSASHHFSGGSDLQTFVEALDAYRGLVRGYDLESFVENLNANDRADRIHDLELFVQRIDDGHCA